MKRLFYNELISWKKNGMVKPLLLTGARQVGKTYLINQFCSNEFRTFKRVNLFEDQIFLQIFESNLGSEEKLRQLRLHLSMNTPHSETILFVDEVQESEGFISFLKFLQEQHAEINIICAGSLLGVKLKRFKKAFPVGKVQIKQLYPFSFEEFLLATGSESYIAEITECFNSNTKMIPALHEKLMFLQKQYCCVGGMPEAITQFVSLDGRIDLFDSSFFVDLWQSYLGDMKKYVASSAESLKIERIYSSIPTQLGNSSARFQYSKAAKGARAVIFATALDWLVAANLVYQASAIKNPEKPISYFADNEVFKLYLNDAGMLAHRMGISFSDLIFDRIGQTKGLIAENYVACELAAKGKKLHYWRSGNSAEVDFILESPEGVVPVEAKSGDNVRAKSLATYRAKYAPQLAIRVSSKNFGIIDGLKSVPLYAAFCLTEL